MHQENQYELNIPDQDMQDILAAIDTLITKLSPHLISLTAENRREMLKMGDKSVAFVTKAKEYAELNPDLVPSYLDLSMFSADIKGVETLRNFAQYIGPLSLNIEDSLAISGSEAYQAALIFYRSVKMARISGVPNAKGIYEDLSSRFPGKGRKASVESATV